MNKRQKKKAHKSKPAKKSTTDLDLDLIGKITPILVVTTPVFALVSSTATATCSPTATLCPTSICSATSATAYGCGC